MIYTKKSRDTKRIQHTCRMCFSNKLLPKEDMCLYCKSFLKEHRPKLHCFICNVQMPKDEYRYIHLGNICQKCSGKITKKVKKDTKKRKKIADKKIISPITGKELVKVFIPVETKKSSRKDDTIQLCTLLVLQYVLYGVLYRLERKLN